MDLQTAMQALESAGSAQTRKTYARHGVTGNMFGVSYAVLGKLVKQIKKDQALAEQLWATGNHDARVLATMIADPMAISSKLLDSWVKDLNNYVIGDAFAKLASRTAYAQSRAEKWMTSSNEWIASAGWNMVACLAGIDDDLPNSYFEKHLTAIERDIHADKNRVRHCMNMTLICIGVRNAALTDKTLAAAARIGKVEVDHGDTDCNTPDAAAYIHKTLAHRKAKAASKKR